MGVSEGRWTPASRSWVRMRRIAGRASFHASRGDRRLREAGVVVLRTSSTSCSTPSTSFLTLTFSEILWRPVDAGDVGAEVEAQVGGIAQERWPTAKACPRRAAGNAGRMGCRLSTISRRQPGTLAFEFGLNRFEIHPFLPLRFGPAGRATRPGSALVPDRARQTAERQTRWAGRR